MLDIAALYTEHARLVRNYLRRRGCGQFSDDDVDDMVQTVFEKALRGAAGYRATGAPVGAWLIRIARNLMIDERRRKQYRQTVPIESAIHVSTPAPSDPVVLPLHILTDEQRDVIVCRYGRGLSGPEAGVALGIPYTAVVQRHKRAIRMLRRALEVA